MRLHLDDGDRPVLLARLGLPENTSEADLHAAITARVMAESAPVPPPANPATPATPPADPPADPSPTVPPPADPPNPPADPANPQPPADPNAEEDDDVEGVISVDAAAFKNLTVRAGLADKLKEDARIKERDDLVNGAIKAGQFPPSRREHYKTQFDKDPDGTKSAIGKMMKGVVPVEERGKDAVEDEMASPDAYDPSWVPEVAARQANANPGTAAPAAEPRRRSRIQSED